MARKLADMDEDETRTYMELLGQATDSIIPEGALFAIFVFGDAGDVRYVSSATRESVASAMRELIAGEFSDEGKRNRPEL